MSQNWNDLQDKINAWADATFGEEDDFDDLIDHLEEEVDELRENPYDPTSFADVLILLLRIAHKSELTADDLLEISEAKHTINATQRIWNTDPNSSRRYRPIGE